MRKAATPEPFDKPLDLLGALSLSKRLRVPSKVEGLTRSRAFANAD
jgi:hypothetical protein